MKTPQVLEVLNSPFPFSNPVEPTLEMLAWCWDWNGKKMVKVYYVLKFDRFRGTKSINRLDYYPLSFDLSNEKTIAEIKVHSERYIKSVSVDLGAKQMFTYQGDALGDRRKVLASADHEEVGFKDALGAQR